MRKKYSVPVQMSRHPQLNEYVRSAVDGIRPWLVRGLVSSVSVVISNKACC